MEALAGKIWEGSWRVRPATEVNLGTGISPGGVGPTFRASFRSVAVIPRSQAPRPPYVGLDLEHQNLP